MKILLTAINAKYIHSNLAVYCLRAYASKQLNAFEDALTEKCNGQKYINIEIAEYTINQQMEDIMMDIYERKPDVLCLSCYIWNLQYVESLVREIHKVCPDMPIWLGGPEVSYDAKEVLDRLPEVTGVMMGEGEKTFAELCEFYRQIKELKDIDGITYRTKYGDIVENPWRMPMDLSEVPFGHEVMGPDAMIFVF